MLGRMVIVQGPPVSNVSLAPRTKATIPQPAKDSAHPFARETNSRVNIAALSTPDGRAKELLPPFPRRGEPNGGLRDVVDFNEANSGPIVYPRKQRRIKTRRKRRRQGGFQIIRRRETRRGEFRGLSRIILPIVVSEE